MNAGDLPTRWKRGREALQDWFSDYLMLVRNADILCHLPSARIHRENNGQKLSPFRIDEMAIEMEAVSRTHKPSLLLAFQSQIYLDTCFALGSFARRGMDELRVRSSEMLRTLSARDKLERKPTPKGWTREDEDLVTSFKHEAEAWSRPVDIVGVLRRGYVNQNLHKAMDDSRSESTLMRRNPMLCGLLLFRLTLKYQQLGLRLCNEWSFLIHAAHLVVACRHSGRAFGESELPEVQWPDMDKVLEMHGADMFGSKAPSTIEESQSCLLRMQGAPANAMQAMRFHGKLPDDRRGTPGSHARPLRTLQDHGQMQEIFLRRFVGDADGTCIDVNAVESLLKSMRTRDELEEAKQRRKLGSGDARAQSALVKRPLRQERTRNNAKFTIPQPLSVLEAGLRRETESIRFDYVSMHMRCMHVLRAAFVASPDFFTSLLEDASFVPRQIELPFFAGHILMGASAVKRETEKVIRHRQDVKDSTLLRHTADAIEGYLAKHPGSADAELNTMRFHMHPEWEVVYVSK